MPLVKNKATEENREFWSHVETVAAEVKKWPDWTWSNSLRESKEQRTVAQCSESRTNEGAAER